MVIVFFSNCQGDNGYLWLIYCCQYCFEIINFGVQCLFYYINYVCGSGVGGYFGDGIQQILLLEIGDLLFVVNQINFGVVLVVVVFVGQYIGIYSLMSVMKCVKIKMNDMGDQCVVIVGWQCGVSG